MFELGQVVMTRGVADLIADNPAMSSVILTTLRMHAKGNWGEICEEDRMANEVALKDGNRLMSVHWLDNKHSKKIWIITEADRSATTILFPSEY